jgi:nitroimidazol reductase NimA-like FMN-containing flavoprotein (pyridoxamine 5'-phosphate oxidase superfamily)
MATRTWLIELSKEACEELLGTAVIGRLGVIIDGKPQVFPISHLYDRGSVIFPTNDRAKMHAALAWPWVGFEVDGIDADGLHGWSVMVQGRAEEITDADVIERAAARRTILWRDGESVHWIRIVATEMTGRRISAETIPDQRASAVSKP